MPDLPTCVDRLVRIANSHVSRQLSLRLAHEMVGSESHFKRWLERTVIELMLRPSACCPEGGPHHRFIRRYLDLNGHPERLDLLRSSLSGLGRDRAGQVLEAYFRMAVLGTLRHEVLAMGRDRLGAPPAVIIEAQIAPYARCNLECEGCYTEGQRGGPSADRGQLEFLVDEAASCGAWAVHVVGKGEPFLDWGQVDDLLSVIAARSHLMFMVATNGIWMPRELARRLGRLGNVLVMVSVDGPREVHDARRGAGTFDQVMCTLELLKASKVLFGFACMVSGRSYRHVTSVEHIRAMTRAGCVAGVFSRYFPLSPSARDDLVLTPERLAEYRPAFDRARREVGIPLIDFDEVEEHTGCRSRAGISVYIDGVTGAVSPCIRVPFSPPECRLDRDRSVGLAHVLGHPFFRRYREAGAGGASWCGHDPASELSCVMADLAASGFNDERLPAYRDRWSSSTSNVAQRSAP
jgi:MoaA/NifB/PqqE/SkfB family radical SAM enzyme